MHNYRFLLAAIRCVEEANYEEDYGTVESAIVSADRATHAIADYEKVTGRDFWEDYESEMDAREYAALSEDL